INNNGAVTLGTSSAGRNFNLSDLTAGAAITVNAASDVKAGTAVAGDLTLATSGNGNLVVTQGALRSTNGNVIVSLGAGLVNTSGGAFTATAGNSVTVT